MTGQKSYSKLGLIYISYGQYHHNLINKIIHIIFVPIITLTYGILLNYIPSFYNYQGYQIGMLHVFLLATIFYYLTLSINYALLFTLFTIGVKYAFTGKFQNWSTEKILLITIVVHIISWVAQFVGHGIFEKRKPALFDNLGQILSAPLFVMIELLALIGIKSKQFRQWESEIKRKVYAFKQQNKIK